MKKTTKKKAKRSPKIGFETGMKIMKTAVSDPTGEDTRRWPECADSTVHNHPIVTIVVKDQKTGKTVAEVDHVHGYVLTLLRAKKEKQINSLLVGLTGCQASEIINGLFESQKSIAESVYGEDATELMQKAYRLAAGDTDHWADEKSNLGE